MAYDAINKCQAVEARGLNIGIDLDDVLANFIDKYIAICNRLHGKPPIGAKPVDWEWSNFGLTRAQQDDAWAEVRQTYNFWDTLGTEEGATRDQLERLDNKHSLFFITARALSTGDSIQRQSCRWLLNNFGIPFPTVLVTVDKGPLAAALKLDYFIDDRPKNVIEIATAVPTCKVFLKNSMHNAGYDSPYCRIPTFDDFAKLIMDGDEWRAIDSPLEVVTVSNTGAYPFLGTIDLNGRVSV